MFWEILHLFTTNHPRPLSVTTADRHKRDESIYLLKSLSDWYCTIWQLSEVFISKNPSQNNNPPIKTSVY